MTPQRDEMLLAVEAIELIKAHLPLRDLLTADFPIFTMLAELRPHVLGHVAEAPCESAGSWSYPFDVFREGLDSLIEMARRDGVARAVANHGHLVIMAVQISYDFSSGRAGLGDIYSCPLGFMAAWTFWLFISAFESPLVDLHQLLTRQGAVAHVDALWRYLRVSQLFSKRWRLLELLDLVASQSLAKEDRERRRYREETVSVKCDNQSRNNSPIQQSSDVIPDRNLLISVLAYNRPHSLVRLLQSLSMSHYFGQRVDLLISVDLNRDGLVHSETLEAAKTYPWPHGSLTVRVRDRHYGLAEQWIQAIPEDRLQQEDGTILLILEDDIEVSPFFFKWLRKAHTAYERREDIGGFTLQRAHILPQKGRVAEVRSMV
ncbi:unnamed protein product [Vitrella brassicaformis CCMP3155]|uniref:Glycosyltransferase 2-like domain-containing protein n=1 Tax=Vitrella brassicaformis (strain CCMP3155) TaxID=1169540 RepID=A0A0G4EVK4_VITBC|nr:unnamed protein product [Vitrella brassicaformis CCMP3155]|eukprot:CEM02313.1 unnamed protein product [Vitrella brassicaformis CCMP3155]